MKATSQAIETHLATLRRTPLLIGAIAEHLREEQLRARPRPNDWSLVEPEDMRGLRVPTLIMTASNDWIVSGREADRYASAIACAVLETVPGAGHLFPETQWQRTNAALLALLAR